MLQKFLSILSASSKSSVSWKGQWIKLKTEGNKFDPDDHIQKFLKGQLILSDRKRLG